MMFESLPDQADMMWRWAKLQIRMNLLHNAQ